MRHYRSIHKIVLLSMLAITAGALITLSSASLGYASASGNNNDINNPYATLKITPNEIAAGGPIPPNYTLAQQEAECIAGKDNAPWYPTMNGYERGNGNRTGLFECATFTGSLTDPNQVYAYRSQDIYYTPSIMITNGINEMYVLGGSQSNSNPIPTSTYVASVEPGTLKELWRTVLVNQNMSNLWTGVGTLENIDGYLFAQANAYLYKLNSTTGKVEGMITLPTGSSLPSDIYFNGMGGWSDGTLVMKNLARESGCDLQGFNAVVKCPGNSSTLVAVDSNTLEILDREEIDQLIGGRVTATQYNGTNYVYLPGTKELYRYVWDGQNLTQDESWGPVQYLLPNQTAASACGIMHDWVICQTNGGYPTNVPVSVFAISQANASKITRIQPMPLEPGQVSYIPSIPSFDPINNRIYTMDPGPGKVAAVDFDPKTGNMTLAWSVDQKTPEWTILIGPADQRVLVGTNIKTNITNPLDYNAGPIGANYKEQIVWRDASTGKLLAASDYFSPMIPLFQLWPGYGGLIYEGLNDGHIMTLKVLPAANATSTANMTSTTTTSTAAGQNSTSGAG